MHAHPTTSPAGGLGGFGGFGGFTGGVPFPGVLFFLAKYQATTPAARTSSHSMVYLKVRTSILVRGQV